MRRGSHRPRPAHACVLALRLRCEYSCHVNLFDFQSGDALPQNFSALEGAGGEGGDQGNVVLQRECAPASALCEF